MNTVEVGITEAKMIHFCPIFLGDGGEIVGFLSRNGKIQNQSFPYCPWISKKVNISIWKGKMCITIVAKLILMSMLFSSKNKSLKLVSVSIDNSLVYFPFDWGLYCTDSTQMPGPTWHLWNTQELSTIKSQIHVFLWDLGCSPLISLTM